MPTPYILASELTKGQRVKLANGWKATLLDNNWRGKTRLCKVYGFATESGSVYTADITQAEVLVINGTKWRRVRHLPTQAEAKRLAASIAMILRTTGWGDFVVAFMPAAWGMTKGESAASAYFTTSTAPEGLADALDAAYAMAKQRHDAYPPDSPITQAALVAFAKSAGTEP